MCLGRLRSTAAGCGAGLCKERVGFNPPPPRRLPWVSQPEARPCAGVDPARFAARPRLSATCSGLGHSDQPHH